MVAGAFPSLLREMFSCFCFAEGSHVPLLSVVRLFDFHCCHINLHNQVRGHRTGSSHSGAEEYPRENTHTPRWYTHISQLTQFMPPPEAYKSEIGSQSTMCQVQAGAYVSLLTPEETKYSDCHPRKIATYLVYITRSIYHYAYARQA